jgi:hypothetical protein
MQKLFFTETMQIGIVGECYSLKKGQALEYKSRAT